MIVPIQRVPGRRWVRGRLLENVGKLNMMLRRENACCLGRNRNRGQGAPTRGNRGRGTDSSNRVPSSRESANSWSLTKAHADRSRARPPASRQGGGTESSNLLCSSGESGANRSRSLPCRTPIHFPSINRCACTREVTSSAVNLKIGTGIASIWTGTRVPRNTGFPPMILPINRSLVGASGRAD